MESQATYDDVNLILHLYELRRDEKLRKAREWFAQSFKARTLEELNALCPVGSETNAYMRMVVSYWNMVASFITGGVLNEELFFVSGRELLFAWERFRDVLPQMREANKDPIAFKDFEIVANKFIHWMNRQSPDIYPTFSARVRGM